MDRGANGGIAGDDVRIIEPNSFPRFVSVQGIDNHTLENIPVVSVGGVANTQHGEFILVMHWYAHFVRGKTIHSSPQLESYGNGINERSIKLEGGKQRIKTLDGFIIPLDIISGLPYMNLRTYTDD